MAARHDVLYTTELLEAILLQVDMQTLLTSGQLVCKKWNDLITHSRAIQQALFFRPASHLHKRVQNPLLAKLFPLWFPASDSKLKPFSASDLSTLPLAREGKKEAYLRKEASWRRMFIQQPPARSLGYIEILQSHGGTSYKRYFLPFDQGVRMNAFYDTALFPLGNLKRDPQISCIWWEGPKSESSDPVASSTHEKAKTDAAVLSDIVIETWEGRGCEEDDGLGIYADPWKSTRSFQFPHRDWKMSVRRRDLKPADQGTIHPDSDDDGDP